eukprot:Gregarina_sp_Poly_1__5817@NODE_3063_length_1412_cov_351_977695_g279_i1_p2_GENE_NODE_3063_length_1412_cov_351_977695_g279_i1NODE_3063_length_1412_cov_351_977695_g279_i1_p2_ORF_typecomplete_len129_score23_74Ribosomal_L22e/PF01776_17/3_4e11Ribosomal_L22e/PF01776_17/8_3e24DUF3857/PF12969_7/0_091_NODE_3063_length_1412_cov_351_977695_g279_i1161547
MAIPRKTNKPTTTKFVVDCTQMHKDNIIDPAGLEKFLIDKIKVDGKTGNFEKVDGRTGKVDKSIVVTRDKSKVMIDAVLPFKKRYIKYLTKKYLKKQQIRDFLRVIATGPTAYTLKYFLPRSKMAGEA